MLTLPWKKLLTAGEKKLRTVIGKICLPYPRKKSLTFASEQHDILELLHRRRKRSSTIFCSQYEDTGWYDQLGGDDSLLAEAILDRIKYDAYKINIVPVNPANSRSMREVYGLDPTLSE